jgi:hypothetical protein
VLGLVHVGFVADKLALGQIFLQVHWFPLSISFRPQLWPHWWPQFIDIISPHRHDFELHTLSVNIHYFVSIQSKTMYKVKELIQ